MAVLSQAVPEKSLFKGRVARKLLLHFFFVLELIIVVVMVIILKRALRYSADCLELAAVVLPLAPKS